MMPSENHVTSQELYDLQKIDRTEKRLGGEGEKGNSKRERTLVMHVVDSP